VSVVDKGGGIRTENMPKQFKPFPGIHIDGVKTLRGWALASTMA